MSARATTITEPREWVATWESAPVCVWVRWARERTMSAVLSREDNTTAPLHNTTLFAKNDEKKSTIKINPIDRHHCRTSSPPSSFLACLPGLLARSYTRTYVCLYVCVCSCLLACLLTRSVGRSAGWRRRSAFVGLLVAAATTAATAAAAVAFDKFLRLPRAPSQKQHRN